MNKYISTLFIIWMTFLPCENLFSQSTQSENKTEITDTKESKLFNEGGYVSGVTTARLIGLLEMALAIASIVFAIKARKSASYKKAKNALMLGGLAIIFSIVHFATVAGAVFGSGSGKAGAILAILLSLIGITISGLVLRHNKA